MRLRLLSCVALIVAAAPVPVTADTVYPPGTECANLPTIAGRLLCGRQELKRGDAAARQPSVPAPPYDGYSPDPDAAQPPPNGTTNTPPPLVLPNTNSPATTPTQP